MTTNLTLAIIIYLAINITVLVLCRRRKPRNRRTGSRLPLGIWLGFAWFNDKEIV